MRGGSGEYAALADRSAPEYVHGMAHLVDVVQELSRARDLDTVVEIVRHAAREISGADGATFVLREGDLCHYVDENAISPLWKGKRFDMNLCISGWAMMHGQPVVIEDIYEDHRIPRDVYKLTFVKSLLMVPIRSESPIGAIGNYWANRYMPSPEEVAVIQALADVTSVAMENVQLYSDLEERVRRRTRELELANEELQAFSYSVSHDLRAPLASILQVFELLQEGLLSYDEFREKAGLLRDQVENMDELIQSLLHLSSASRKPLKREETDLSALATEILSDLAAADSDHRVDVRVAPDLRATVDAGLARIALTNLLSNAWKYSRHVTSPCIEFDLCTGQGEPVFYIRDNGVGFDMDKADRLFRAHARLHTDAQFEGTGIGLATVARIIERHGGRIRAESGPDNGATFYFTWGEDGMTDRHEPA